MSDDYTRKTAAAEPSAADEARQEREERLRARVMARRWRIAWHSAYQWRVDSAPSDDGSDAPKDGIRKAQVLFGLQPGNECRMNASIPDKLAAIKARADAGRIRSVDADKLIAEVNRLLDICERATNCHRYAEAFDILAEANDPDRSAL